MAEQPLFTDGDTETALTLRVAYDGRSGTVLIAAAMHARGETPPSLAVIHSVNAHREGWWAVHNRINEEVATYAICEDSRVNATPF